MASENTPSQQSYTPTLLGFAILGIFLYVAKAVLVPLILSVLLAFVLMPIVMTLQRLRINRTFAVLATVMFAFVIVGGVSWIVGIQVHDLARDLPKHRKEIEAKLASLRKNDGVPWNLVKMLRELGNNETDLTESNPPASRNQEVVVIRRDEPGNAERIVYALAPMVEPLAHAVLVIILVVFILFNREDLRNRFIGLMGHGHLTGTTRVIVDTAQRLSRLLLAQLMLNVVFGMIFGIGLFVLGVDFAFLWGFLTAILRFVPYIGTWISALLPLTLSFATVPDWTQPILVLVFIAVLDTVMGNLVDPLLLGRSSGVFPMALLVAAAFWTWLWGPIGLFLSTPLTVCLVVLGQHFPQFRFFALLLGDQPALQPPMMFYQRLLARDQSEALELASTHARTMGVAKVCDEVLVPALVLARNDRRLAGLTAEDERFIVQATHEILDTLVGTAAEEAVALAETAPAPEEHEESHAPSILILGCPAHDESEELSLRMLAEVMKPDDCQVEVISTRALPAEISTTIEREKPALIFIAVLPPGGLMQCRYLCKRFRKRFANIPIVVGYWGDQKFDMVLRQLRLAGAAQVSTTLLQARSQILAMIGLPPVDVREPTLQGAAG